MRGDVVISKRIIRVWIEEWCKNTNIEIIETFDWDKEEHDIIEFVFGSYHNSCTNFKSDIDCLIENLENVLDADVFVGKPDFKHKYIKSNDKENTRYVCSLIVGK